ncbi:MAG: hypothetical protein IJW59_02065 [Clostridia bacterium]|nr:hypothetical protein [Clostridia bacterium]
MKRFFVICAFCGVMFLSGCGAVSVDHDLTNKKASMVYTIVTNMNSSPSAYANKSYKINGDIEGSLGYYSLIVFDDTNCCSAELALVLDNGVTCPKKKTNVTVIGEYVQIDGQYCLKVTKIS